MSIAIKKGVSITGIQPEILLALQMLSSEYHELVITGGTEKANGRIKNSLHKKGLAVDIRMPGPCDSEHCHDPNCHGRLLRMAVYRLFSGGPYDYVIYDDHVHIEYDPK